MWRLGRVFEEGCKDPYYKGEKVVLRQREEFSESKNEEDNVESKEGVKGNKEQGERWKME